MTKLIATYRAAPTDANRAKLARYIELHYMALCFATDEEQAFLQANWFIA
jgi:hypothetical protein